MSKRILKSILPSLSLLLYMSLQSHGQMNYRQGWIITAEGDTLHGLIRDRGTLNSSRSCRFKISREADPADYDPYQIRGYETSGYKRFRSMEWEIDTSYRRVFSEVLLEGDLSLYLYPHQKNLAYIIRKRNGILLALQAEEIHYHRKTEMAGDRYVYGNKIEGYFAFYKDSLRVLFADQPDLSSKVDRLPYKTRPILNITRSYMEAGCDGDGCISYEKDLRLTRDRFGFFSGVQLSSLTPLDSGFGHNPTMAVPAGIFVQFPISLINDRFTFQLGLTFRSLQYVQTTRLPPGSPEGYMRWSTLGVPLSFNYRLSVKKFSPFLGAGKEFGYVLSSSTHHVTSINFLGEYITETGYIHRSQRGAWFADLGVSYELNTGLSFFSAIRLQRHLNKRIEDKYQNNFIFKNAEGEEYATYAASLHVGVRF